MVYQRIWGHEKRKTSPLTRSDEADLLSSVCVCPLTNHDQQPMKVHTAVTLLYNFGYIVNSRSPCTSYIIPSYNGFKSNEHNLKLKMRTNCYIRLKITYLYPLS